ncbi:MAG TPA: hypothetical protein VGI22_05245 [Xanthobacteraceae bacterium]|jgi:hypothetical protein
MPCSIARSEETIFSGHGGFAENIGVIGRIDPVQAARDHEPALAVEIISRLRRGRVQRTPSATMAASSAVALFSFMEFSPAIAACTADKAAVWRACAPVEHDRVDALAAVRSIQALVEISQSSSNFTGTFI